VSAATVVGAAGIAANGKKLPIATE
jgi:hypothetical protein